MHGLRHAKRLRQDDSSTHFNRHTHGRQSAQTSGQNPAQGGNATRYKTQDMASMPTKDLLMFATRQMTILALAKVRQAVKPVKCLATRHVAQAFQKV